jgi:hypothetical protein
VVYPIRFGFEETHEIDKEKQILASKGIKYENES